MRHARLVERYAAAVVVVWLAVTVGITLSAPSIRDLGTADQTAFVPASAPSGQADALLRAAFPDDPTRDPAVIVVARPGGLQPGDRAYIQSLADFLRSPAAAAHVKAVQTAATSPELAPVLRSPDAAAELLIVSLKAQVFSASAERAVSFLRDHLAATTPAGLQAEVTGLAALASDQTVATLEAFDKTAVATVLLVLLILIMVYRSVLAPLISLVTIGCAFLVARGLAGYLADSGLEVASLAETFMIVIAFGAGTDYVMFVLSRYRETTRNQTLATPAHTVQLAAATRAVSPTIVASGATVSLAFFAFLAAELGLFRSFGPVLGVAIAVTVAASLTLTPALMRLAGRALFWPARPGLGRRQRADERWRRTAALVARRPLAVLLISVGVLALPATAAGQTKSSFDIPAELPPTAGARQGFETLAEHYPPGVLAPAFVVVSADDSLLTNERMAAVDRLTEALRSVPGVAQVRSVTQPAGAPLTKETLKTFTGGSANFRALGIDPDQTDVGPLLTAISAPGGLRITADLLNVYPGLGERLGYFLGDQARTTRIVVAFDSSPYAASVLTTIHDLDAVAAATLAGSNLDGARVAVGGPSAYFSDIQTLANSDLRTVGALVLGTILLVLALLVRSVIAPIYLLASAVLSMLAALGITTLVFQGLLGHDGLAFYLPVFMFVMLVALGSDYNIFIVGRIREELDAGRNVREATVNALVSTGPTITAAGFVLAGTFAALLITPLPSIRQIGFGVAVGILLDTFVVRTLLVPAATILLGRWAFWPSTGRVRRTVRPQPAVAAATAGLIVAAVALPGWALASREELEIAQVPSHPLAAGSGSPRPTADPARGGQPKAPTTGPKAAPRTSTSPKKAAAKPTRSPTNPAPAPAAPADKPRTPAVSIAAPSPGPWLYRVEGSRTVGAAGTAQPFAEDAESTVTRTGGPSERPEFAIRTETSFATTEENRRYTPGAVDALSLKANALGMAYGGTFDSPQQLIRSPIRIGDNWTSRWKAGGTRGETTSTVTGARSVTVEAQRLTCYVVERSTTMSGDVSGVQHQRTCWVPGLGMPVIDRQELRGTYQGISFDVTATMTLLSPPTGDAPPGPGGKPASIPHAPAHLPEPANHQPLASGRMTFADPRRVVDDLIRSDVATPAR